MRPSLSPPAELIYIAATTSRKVIRLLQNAFVKAPRRFHALELPANWRLRWGSARRRASGVERSRYQTSRPGALVGKRRLLGFDYSTFSVLFSRKLPHVSGIRVVPTTCRTQLTE
jgi:hypothetical protein